MTAEIGLLNKSAVVLAADSAVTISRANKVFNNATKIFRLCGNVPVGIMIYNNSHWMGIPLEVIIKEYSKFRKGHSFPNLEDYTLDFKDFIVTNFTKHISKEQYEEFITSRTYDILETFVEVTEEEVNELLINKKENPKTILEQEALFQKTFESIINAISKQKINEVKLVEFSEYSLTQFTTEFGDVFDKVYQGFCANYKMKEDKGTSKKLLKCLFDELTHSFSFGEDYTGVVIAGYGDNEIYPSISELIIGETFSSKLRYEIKKIRKVGHKNSAIVVPFAQRDMVDTFFQGIDPSLVNEIQNILKFQLDSLKNTLIKDNKSIDKTKLQESLNKTFDNIGKSFKAKRAEIHVKPIVSSISYLRKDDLIEIAEALVNITSLKRKTSNDLQTVGGPVDIVVITKGDGLKWVKRKEEYNKEIDF